MDEKLIGLKSAYDKYAAKELLDKKLVRDIQFDSTKFNDDFEKSFDEQIHQEYYDKFDKFIENQDELIDQINEFPHQEPVQTILTNVQELLITILNMLSKFKNPFGYIFKNNKNLFSFTLLILFSSLFILAFTNILK